MNLFKSKKSTKNKKLYKVVYKQTGSIYDRSHTLLVPGDSPVDAIEYFYKKAGNDVKDILEFTEITYGTDMKTGAGDV